jgi:hypothetical protein
MNRFVVPAHQCWNFETICGARKRVGIGLSYRPTSAGILKQSMGATDQVGTGLSYRHTSAGILKQSMGARKRVGIGLSYRPARLHRLSGFYKSFKTLALATKAGGIDFLESTTGLLKSLKIPSLYSISQI